MVISTRDLALAGADVARDFAAARAATLALCDPLSPEDCAIQSMPDVSPTRWHLAHTTWFFETFVLEPQIADYVPFKPAYRTLFNSYYETVGEQHPRAQRGLLSRPTLAEVLVYRAVIDQRVLELLRRLAPTDRPAWLRVVQLGVQHEQQHQELILTDIKHVLACNPLYPAYRQAAAAPAVAPAPQGWLAFEPGVRWIGREAGGIAFDNERPRHRVYVDSFELADRLVTNAEYLAFIDDNGYGRSDLWLADGWAKIHADGWAAPLYWVHREDGWHEFTLAGLRPLEPNAPVCHLSYYEADAFARWAGARLPTEQEWEIAVEDESIEGNFVESERLHPSPAPAGPRENAAQLFGDVWEWTSSAYAPYPGFRPLAGSLGEYNGKFMCSQYVLRGGSCATPRSHVRPTYRNFFYPHQRWQFSGFRLARARG
ncbi:MAG: ergothioneine biosynthesis protein EgtB [Planctomycetota bacterium]